MDSTVTPGTTVELGPLGLESSAAASAASAFGPATRVEQYNGDVSLGWSLNQWSWSEDRGASSSWTACVAAAPCPAPCCRAGAAPGDPTVPFAPGQTAWAGDPVLAAGLPGHVVMLNVGGSKRSDEQIVASLSLDGGRTFLATVRVNNPSGDCGGGQQDQPHATFDLGTSPPTLWVVWRHKGTVTYGGCVRGGTIDATNPGSPVIDWLGPALTVDNMDRDDEFYGQGGLLIAARTAGDLTRISVMYSNTDQIFHDCSGGKNIAWDTVTSDNLGVDWYTPVRIVGASDFDWCAAGDTVELGLREFWFALDHATGDYWAAVHDSPSRIGIFASRDEGASWARVHNVVEPGSVLFQPNIAVDSAGRVAVSWWRDRGFQIQRMATAFGVPRGRWSAPIALTGLFEAGQGQSANGGDYQSLISVPSGLLPGGATFFAAWSQMLEIETLPLAVTP